MTVRAPICMECIRFHDNNLGALTCDAFPDGIPIEIIESKIDHTKPYKGDNGIQFEGKD